MADLGAITILNIDMSKLIISNIQMGSQLASPVPYNDRVHIITYPLVTKDFIHINQFGIAGTGADTTKGSGNSVTSGQLYPFTIAPGSS